MLLQPIDRVSPSRHSAAGEFPHAGLKVAAAGHVSAVSVDTPTSLPTPDGVIVQIEAVNRQSKVDSNTKTDGSVNQPKNTDQAKDKVKEPEPEPISKMMIEFLQTIWRMSGSAIEAATDMQQPDTNGKIANSPAKKRDALPQEAMTYSLAKIKKTDGLLPVHSVVDSVEKTIAKN